MSGVRVRSREYMTPHGLKLIVVITFVSPTDVFSVGPWSTLKGLQDAELQRLAKALPNSVLQSKATSTTRKYLGAFKRWKNWASEHQLVVFPVEATNLALYLQHLGESKSSKSAVEEAVHGLSWAHTMAGIPTPTCSPFVQATLEGLKRTLSKPVCKKSPFTIEMLQAIVCDVRKDDTLANLRLAAVCLISFAGFLRFDEVANIRPCDLAFDEDHLTIQIPRSKTDQMRQGNEVIIARTGTDTCPVAMLESYMQRGRVQLCSDLKLFRPIVGGKSEKLRNTGGISYSNMRELLKKKLEQLGFPAADFSLHSLRVGGATAAAAAGVPDRVFKKHGRWKSESAKDGYVEDSFHERLSVTKNLGL